MGEYFKEGLWTPYKLCTKTRYSYFGVRSKVPLLWGMFLTDAKTLLFLEGMKDTKRSLE